MKCEENRTIALTSHIMKIPLKVISNRIKPVLNRKIGPFQYGFMPNRGTLHAIIALNIIASIRIEQEKAHFVGFVDFVKAFHRVYHQKLMEILEREKIGDKSLRISKNLYATQTAQMRMEPKTKISVTRGVRQGCILSPTLYNIYAGEALKEFGRSKGTTIGRARVTRLMYADDTAMLSDTKEELKELIEELMEKRKDFGLTINFKKTKIMKISRTGKEETPMNIGGKEIETVTTFNYLGAMFQNNNKEGTEVRRRIGMAKQAF